MRYGHLENNTGHNVNVVNAWGKGSKMIQSPFYWQYSTDDSTKVDRQ